MRIQDLPRPLFLRLTRTMILLRHEPFEVFLLEREVMPRIEKLTMALHQIKDATGGNGLPFANKWARGIAEEALKE